MALAGAVTDTLLSKDCEVEAAPCKRGGLLFDLKPKAMGASSLTLKRLPVRRDDPERRFSVALVVSASVHVAALVLLAHVGLNWKPSSPAGFGPGGIVGSVLQATIAQPEVAQPLPLLARSDVPAFNDLLPMPVVPTQPSPPGLVGVAGAPNVGTTSVAGGRDPRVVITVGAVPQKAIAAEPSAMLLAERYPYTVARGPELKASPVILYPRAALDARRQARIRALLAISETGKIVEQSIVPDDPDFHAAVVAALKESDFRPAEKDGKRLPYWTVLEFEFQIPEMNVGQARR